MKSVTNIGYTLSVLKEYERSGYKSLREFLLARLKMEGIAPLKELKGQ